MESDTLIRGQKLCIKFIDSLASMATKGLHLFISGSFACHNNLMNISAQLGNQSLGLGALRHHGGVDTIQQLEQRGMCLLVRDEGASVRSLGCHCCAGTGLKLFGPLRVNLIDIR